MSPAESLRSPAPGVSSTNLIPSGERGRTLAVVSAASGSTFLSSFRFTIATALPESLTPGPTRSTKPTRKPPTRTSLPFTSLAPVGSSAFTS